ncbi:MAG: mannose-1-phosphate guanylyltransferase [Candidatus Berkelbacteria bacterium]
MQKNHFIVIMAGGSGTRLWPISRANLPKQFHKFASNEKSLIQETYDRIKDLVPVENIYVSLVENIYKTTRDQLPEIDEKNYIVEPQGKNTAPAVGLIAALIQERNPEAIIATVASDHTVEKVETFQKVIKQAFKFIEENNDYLVTVGITPTEPNTGYGYIKVGRKFSGEEINEVERFVEKPNQETAERYIKSGDYLWNASYFIWKASAMMKNFKKFAPQIHERLGRIAFAVNSKDFKMILEKEYAGFDKEAIEPVIIEKIKNVAVIKADLGWSDVGTWSSLYEFLSKDTGSTNVKRGNHIGINDSNCLFYAHDKLLATVGLENIIIVDTPDVTLVCDKNKTQEIKDLMEKLKNKDQGKYL